MTNIECPICLEVKEEFNTLLCGHSFCLECINQLIERGEYKKCALCRTAIITNLNVEIPEISRPSIDSVTTDSTEPEEIELELIRRRNDESSCCKFIRENYDFSINMIFASFMVLALLFLVIGFELNMLTV